MNKILTGIFAVTLCFAISHALECYKCDIGFLGLCITTKMTCDSGQLCYSGQGKAASVIKVSMKGCLPEINCNKTSNVTLPGSSDTTVYQMTKTCCIGDLCNNAVPLANTHTLTLAFASLASFFLTKMLV